MSRARDLQLGFADWKFLRQGIVLERELQSIIDFLDEHEEMIEAVGVDLRRGLKNANTGRKGLTPQQVLRSLVLMRVKNWDYRELRERIADGLTLRLFTDFNAQPVPKHDAFQRSVQSGDTADATTGERAVDNGRSSHGAGRRPQIAGRHHRG